MPRISNRRWLYKLHQYKSWCDLKWEVKIDVWDKSDWKVDVKLMWFKPRN